MASEALTNNAVNKLDPTASIVMQAPTTPAASPDSNASQTVYPSWLTDLSARGIAGDWVADAHVNPDVIGLTPAEMPPQASQAVMAVAPEPQVGLSAVGGGGGEGGSASTGGNDISDQSPDDSGSGTSAADQGTADAAAAAGDTGSSSAEGGNAGGPGGEAGDGLFKGGVITPNKLSGPNPPGPDDGYGKLKLGEGVLTGAAMKYYGPAFLAKLNKLAVSKNAAR